jgi:cell envelope opacity-associated protein A
MITASCVRSSACAGGSNIAAMQTATQTTIRAADILNADQCKAATRVPPSPLQADERLSQRCQFDAQKAQDCRGETAMAGGSIAQSFRENKIPAEAGIL